MPTTLEQYLFDLRGYVCLPEAIDRNHLSELNNTLDSYLDLEPGHWRDWVYRHPDGVKLIICTIYLKWVLLLKD